jgi:hypothetical protein
MKTSQSLAPIPNSRKQKTTQHSNAKKNDSIQTFLQTPTDSTDYSLWKVTNKIKQITKSSPPLRTQQGTWARNNAEKAHVFHKQLEQVFQPQSLENSPEEEDIIQLWKPPTSSNHLSNASKELKFKKLA